MASRACNERYSRTTRRIRVVVRPPQELFVNAHTALIAASCDESFSKISANF